MLILKIVLDVTSVLSTWVIARLDYSWYDKETLEFKKGRLGLFTILSILLLLNIIVTILDEEEKRQQMEKLNNHNAELTSKLENITNELIGGDSFCYFTHRTHMYTSSSETPSYNDIELWLMHSGKHPLYDIQIRLVDIQKSNQVMAEHLKSPMPFDKLIAAGEIRDVVGRLDPRRTTAVFKLDLPANVVRRDFSVFFIARNGGWTQELRFLRTKENETWGLASRTRRGDKVLEEKNSEFLPKDNSGMPKWD